MASPFHFSNGRSLVSVLLLLLCSILTTQAETFLRYESSSHHHATEQQQRLLQTTTTRTDLVGLIPFDVQIALSYQDNAELEAINFVGLTDIITDWMSESFRVKSTSELLDEEDGNGTVTTTLNSVALELPNPRIQTTTVSSSQPLALLTASFEGISLWDRTGTASPMDPDLVELMQRATFLEDNALLQMLLDASTDLTGFPTQESVIDVRAYITPPSDGNNNNSPTSAPSGDNKNLEIVIIVAIVVACLAFGLLIFAVLWAWKSDRKSPTSSHARSKASSSKKSAGAASRKSNKSNATANTKKGFLTRLKESSSKKESPAKAASPVPAAPAVVSEQPPPIQDPLQGSELDFGNSTLDDPSTNAGTGAGTTRDDPYPETVVSEDISSSLTAYYKSGMYNNGNQRGMLKNDFNDAASMSSMDSYGYSLDGYAPSLGTAQGGYPVGPLQAAKDAQITVGDEDDDDVAAASEAEEEEVEDYEAQT